jgi:hypothetical protein
LEACRRVLPVGSSPGVRSFLRYPRTPHYIFPRKPSAAVRNKRWTRGSAASPVRISQDPPAAYLVFLVIVLALLARGALTLVLGGTLDVISDGEGKGTLIRAFAHPCPGVTAGVAAGQIRNCKCLSDSRRKSRLPRNGAGTPLRIRLSDASSQSLEYPRPKLLGHVRGRIDP